MDRVAHDVALSRTLGVDVDVDGLRALFVAVGDWATATGRDMDPDDWYLTAEGLRALPDDERDLALSFFEDDALMARLWQLCYDHSEITCAALDLDPVNAVAERAYDLDPAWSLRGESDEARRQAEQRAQLEYRRDLPVLRMRVVDAITAVDRTTERVALPGPRVALPRARHRQSHRARPGHARRNLARSGSPPGDDDPPGDSDHAGPAGGR